MAEVKQYPSGKGVEPEDKKIQKVVSGEVKTKKKSGASKFKEAFIEDDARNVGDYILMDVLVPAAKKAISDVVQDGIEILLYGETSARKRSTGSRISYNNYYSQPTRPRDRDSDRNRHDSRSYSYDDIVLESRADAEEVLNNMFDLIDRYGMVSVADLYELVDISCKYTDNNYGWTDLGNATVSRVRDGYLLKLPRAVPFN